MQRQMEWFGAADLVIRGQSGAISSGGATELSCSEFGEAMIAKM